MGSATTPVRASASSPSLASDAYSRQRPKRPSSSRRIARAYVSSPVPQPACHTLTEGQVRKNGTTRVRKVEEEGGVGEEVAGGAAQRAQQALHGLRVVQHAPLQRGERLQPLLAEVAPQPPQEQRPGVAAQVEAVVTADPLQEEVHLDGLELGAASDGAHPVTSVRGARALASRGTCSHTRSMLSSLSMSTGLVM